MKYIDADKLIAEIERRKNQTERRLDNIVPIRRKDTMDEEQLAKIELRDKVDKAYLNGVLITLSDILSFIASLQQEQPEVDLEKEFDRYYDSPLWEGENVSWMTYTRIAHHFCNLGRKIERTLIGTQILQAQKDSLIWEDVEKILECFYAVNKDIREGNSGHIQYGSIDYYEEILRKYQGRN